MAERTAQFSPTSMLVSNVHGDIVATIASEFTTATTDYGPFGQATATSGASGRLGWQGSQTDPANGRIHANARTYDPTLGTFISADPQPPAIETAAGTNLYAYAQGNPTSHNDPTGYFWERLIPSPSDLWDFGTDAAKSIDGLLSGAGNEIKAAAGEVGAAARSPWLLRFSKLGGRLVPYAGWALLAYDAYGLTSSVIDWINNTGQAPPQTAPDVGPATSVTPAAPTPTNTQVAVSRTRDVTRDVTKKWTESGNVYLQITVTITTTITRTYPNGESKQTPLPPRTRTKLKTVPLFDSSTAYHDNGSGVVPVIPLPAPIAQTYETGCSKGGDIASCIVDYQPTLPRPPNAPEPTPQTGGGGANEPPPSLPSSGSCTPEPGDSAGTAPGQGNYRGRYNADLASRGVPRLPRTWDAHHRIPQMYRGHPDFAGLDFDAPSNIRGVAGNRVGSGVENIHNQITQQWNQFAAENPCASGSEIEDFASRIDETFGGYWWR